ncbi:MAG: type I 3-dehydroquinate dehydratase [Thermoanaerobaculia bacterium]|nr:type I 3-dehydroquinate dehydratase [Thermoanaerobaculia bacterium]
MSVRAEIVASLTREPSPEELRAIPSSVSVLEVRADLCGDLDAARLRESFGGRLLYTLRSHRESGADRLDGDDRVERILAGSAGYDLVDLEARRDLVPGLLEPISPDRRILSWHGPALDVEGLAQKFLEMARVEAVLYKMVPSARRSGDELAALQLLVELGRRDVIAFSSGPAATWSRHIAARLGAPWIYGSAGSEPAAPGQPSVEDLIRDYGYPEMRPLQGVCGVVGHPVHQSLSPRLHNAAYRRLDLPLLYLALDTDRFADFWLEVVEEDTLASTGMPWVGFSVTSPDKAQALSVAAASSPLADRVGGANTLIRTEDGWAAENTDAEGVVHALEEASGSVVGRRVVVVGAGRAGRAGALGLKLAGAEVTLANRNRDRGLAVAEELDLPFVSLESLDVSGFEVVLQATTLGRHSKDPLPFDPASLTEGTIVMDYVYSRRLTPLLVAARERGLRIIDGREILLAQAVRQFQLMTGQDLPLDLGRQVLGLEEP